MKRSLFKKRIIAILIVALCMNNISYAGYFFWDVDGKKKYMDDKGKVAKGWRWIDTNGDNICECYRFGADGGIATTSTIRGKDVNKDGMWVIDDVVQQIYKTTGKPLYFSNYALGEKDTNKYFDLGTMSETTRRINATDKDVKALMIKDLRADEEAKEKNNALGPNAEYVPSDEGYILSRGATTKLTENRPVATGSNPYIINTLSEEEVIYLEASASIVAGRDAKRFVSSSNKYTESMKNVKIYGGEIWEDCMCLQGNGAYVKFTLTESNRNFKANYFTFEVAHQTHGESTADTYCAIELYLNGKSVTSYDEFCDGEPELIEEWLDDGEKNMEIRAIVTGDAPGRKIYIRNFRFRQIKEKKDND